MYYTLLPSPVGQLYLSSDGESVTGLWLVNQKYFGATLTGREAHAPNLPVFAYSAAWLQAYFDGQPLPSLPPLAPTGSPFRQAVWQLLRQIPRGSVTTYGVLAQKLRACGITASAQAVGGAVGHNPISILIPCHRVVGSTGTLTGYAGGLEAKTYLLRLEGIRLENDRVSL